MKNWRTSMKEAMLQNLIVWFEQEQSERMKVFYKKLMNDMI